ncbi:tetratricopeptide repeat protein [Desulfosediminicola ganghwensis]|uniref:tetratricopeptide repeat protein n=1 Tax=Desulfosediminicola ganghwensis TaxID=2569540 RepID=UPI0010ACBD3C|nr:tetratricopeptide repeat protein [Desulfosediminicola ganghwensis]
MRTLRLFIFALPVVLVSCTSLDKRGTIAQLNHQRVEIREEQIEGGIDKAIVSYQRFLAEAPTSQLAAEAIRRIADLKVEKEYGLIGENKGEDIGDNTVSTTAATETETKQRFNAPEQFSDSQKLSTPEQLSAPETASPPAIAAVQTNQATVPDMTPAEGESESDFEQRATLAQPVVTQEKAGSAEDHAIDDLEKAGSLEAIALYKELLQNYPLYQRNDQVLYQMSRAYEELGRIEEAMAVMGRLVREFPESQHFDEVQFRRAEHFFIHKKYLDAEDAYASIVDMGEGSYFFELALYKLGWTFYKQELYEDGLHRFIALLDHMVSMGYDFEHIEDETERTRIDDTFRVISLSFSYLGGAESVVEYFSTYGKRPYEDSIYSNLGEYYFGKRRYNDAVATYDAFMSRNPFHRKAPIFHIRVIEINIAGGFPTLVIESKKSYATNYGLQADYWQHFQPDDRPEVIDSLKTNLTDLANHYHAMYQNPKYVKEKPSNFSEALHWYREFIASFPKENNTPFMNYQLADLLLENKSYALAAAEYEKTAYNYEPHERSSKAGYTAVYSYRQQLETTPEGNTTPVKKEVVRSSLKFVDTFPEHEKASVVLGAAADDLYSMHEYEQASAAAQKLIGEFPAADVKVKRSAWLVIGHSSYKLELYKEAETAYVNTLALLEPNDKSRAGLVDNLAASIYQQGEQAQASEDYLAAADHYLRISSMAPNSKIRPTAEFDGAAMLIKLKDWDRAATVLTGFRANFPGHELQPEITKKIAFVYREDGKLSQAAAEYEQIERESDDDLIRREVLMIAAELYEEVNNSAKTLEVYRRYVQYFPQPIETNLETRTKIAEIFKKQAEQKKYFAELKSIVAIDAAAGGDRTDRTRYLAGTAALTLTEPSYQAFEAIQLVKPFEKNLRKKRQAMKTAMKKFSTLLDYEVGEVTAASTFYLGEIYADFSKALMESERPEGLTAMEEEEYEIAIEDQAYPFEEKAISVHESNLQLMSRGVYNRWIDKSLERLAGFLPARYDKPEEQSDVMTSLSSYTFEFTVQLPAKKTKAAKAAGTSQNAPAADEVRDVSQETSAAEPHVEEVPSKNGQEADNE